MTKNQRMNVICFIRDAVYPAPYTNNWRVNQVKITWHTAKMLLIDEVHPVLCEFWPMLTRNELEGIFRGFTFIKKLRDGEYAPLRGSTVNVYELGRHDDLWSRSKSGKCPRCGENVKNKNRHNNKQHDRHTCRLNRVKSIMDM